MVWRILARGIVRHPLVPGAVLSALALAAALVVVLRAGFDSEVLNLLPAENPAVRGLKIYNEEFAQAGELAFLLEWDDPRPEAVEMHAEFVRLLQAETWVARALGGSPLESTGPSLEGAGIPLLLNLPPAEFATAMDLLHPDAISSRIAQLVRKATAGSPAAMLELRYDPTGIVKAATGPVAKAMNLEEQFSLESPDGRAFIVPVSTRLPDTSAESCQNLMREVHAFVARVQTALGSSAPTIGVTGRSAYVDEVSTSMRRDLSITSLASGVAVLAIFFLGFRRVLPLIGITIVLTLCALCTLAGGMLAFSELNIIAISFCSILFGLGDDFCLLLCQRYYRARADGDGREAAIARSMEEAMPGILWVALTTAIGFLALAFSGSAGFAQLGAMVALGVILCAVFTPLLLFLFLRGERNNLVPASTGFVPSAFLAWQRAPVAIRFLPALAAFSAVIIAIAPWRPPHFDLSPSSLEPRNTPAAQTLARMAAAFPSIFEPVIVLLPQPTPSSLAALDAVLEKLQQTGRIISFSSPSALVLHADQLQSNAVTIEGLDISQSLEALDRSLASQAIQPAAFADARSLLASLLEIPSDPSSRWSDWLPPASPWWFLIHRAIAPDSQTAAAFINISDELGPDDRVAFAAEIHDAVPGTFVTGWSQMLASLVPWARGELLGFGLAVLITILVVLAVIYRDPRLWLVHVASMLAAGAATIATIKLFGIGINLLNVLAFPLILAVGVDYATHILLMAKERGASVESLAGTVKAVALSGITTAAGFGALALAKNATLAGLGILCATGVLWSLAAALLIAAPAAATRIHRANAE